MDNPKVIVEEALRSFDRRERVLVPGKFSVRITAFAVRLLPRALVACRSEFVTAEAAGGVRVFPLDGPSIGGVGVDVAAEFAS